MSAPALGRLAPDFSLPATGGGTFRLRAARGHALVLYFYPRDSTPGCTLEGQDFQRLLPAFRRAGAQVYGISRDSMAAHEKFCARYGFGFPLLADADGKACALFDVIHEKHMYGRKVLGIVRSTFLIDAAGKLRREWRKVRVEGHAAEVLEALKSL
ncbi:MAG: peroxiredoxin [Gammaproteobacteria bacterium]|nr:peroxiredoxin [Gammaproteobacteria bacterium]MDE2251356.1 peroxiredoxin [Gammaproteobacteria bacterium]